MKKSSGSVNVLMVSNYPSDTAYAWWLMEHFWITFSEIVAHENGRSFLVYPQIIKLSNRVSSSDISTSELVLPWKSITDAIRVLNFIRNNKITIVYLTDQKYLNFQYIFLRLFGVKRVLVHDHTPGDREPVTGFRGWVKHFINRIPYITADFMFCVSPLMRERDILNGRIPRGKCLSIQNGIHPLECSKDKISSIEGFSSFTNNDFIVVTSGRAHPYKRVDFIIDVAKVLKDRGVSGVKFLIIGDGPQYSELLSLVKKYGLNDDVVLLGYRDDVKEILCASDMAIHAALGEGFSLSILEYMSAGLPVLVPDIPSVKQAIDHNINGFVYPINEPEVAAQYIKAMMENSEQCEDMGLKAKRKAADEYSLGLCTEQFINALDLLGIYDNREG